MILRSSFLVLTMLASVARAYPPAPDYTLYGTVRDERGRILPANSAWVIVSHAAGEVVLFSWSLISPPPSRMSSLWRYTICR